MSRACLARVHAPQNLETFRVRSLRREHFIKAKELHLGSETALPGFLRDSPCNMPSVTPERGRTRSRQQTSAYAKSQTPSRTRSPPRRSISPRSASRSRSPNRSLSVRGGNSNGLRSRSRSPTASRSPAGRAYRDRSFSRSRSRASPMPKSSKVRYFRCRHCGIKLIHFQIVVEKLTKNVNENHLHEIFGAYGSIKDLDLPMNRQCTDTTQHCDMSG